ncbi:MAG: hypothetical protein QUV02_01950 [Maricaulis sp.]|uniref:hypothetical protein n=1 Tax=Maricaulis sp. TaxID=1486257 RepID=UPI00262C44B8|nr:hypothetical protein [Maricaulis sp.]MDM7983185.1 hypothetical protein [Maricaulis sp.]
MSRPRITIEIQPGENGGVGELLVHFNAAGRDVLLSQLSRLDEHWDHEHFDAVTISPDAKLDEVAYRPDSEIVRRATFTLRSDEMDAEHCPHVLSDQPASPYD